MLKKELLNSLLEFYLKDAKRIRAENQINGSDDRAYSMIITTLKAYFPEKTYTFWKDSITDCRKDGQLDAIVVNNEHRSIDVFEIKNSTGYNYNDVKLFSDSIEKYLLDHNTNLHGLAPIVIDRIQLARKFISKSKYKLNIYVVRTELGEPATPVVKLIENLKNSYKAIATFSFPNLNKLVDETINFHDNKTFPWEIEIANKQHFLEPENILMKRSGVITALYGLVPLNKIVKLQKDYESKKLDLFNKNVRLFQNNKSMSQ